MASSANFGAFLRAAADAYRASGDPDAPKIADRIAQHAKNAVLEPPPRRPPPAIKYLATVASSPDLHPAARLITGDLANLAWTVGDLEVPAVLRDHFAFVTFIGEESPIPDDELYFGLFLVAPHTHYPLHWHLAEELYFVLSSTSHWEQGDGLFRPQAPGTLIHHLPNEPHAMATGEAPLLAMWVWYGDLRPDTYRLDVKRGARPPGR